MAKIFIRQRRDVTEGKQRPRFAVVAVQGADLQFYRPFLRRVELEQIAAETGAEIVYLPVGEHSREGQRDEQRGRRHRDQE
ncbi:MAG: hypothetical protein JXM73_19520 [Anaerolineae bacterium]|nr:hypothetical protein [Anaerolineae bacterium]